MSEAASQIEISVVVPVYNSAETLPELCARLRSVLAELATSYEIVLADDGSRETTYEVLAKLASNDQHLRVVRMVRNFGQHPALTAGMEQARGQWVVLMDDDLQTPPEEIPKLLAKAREGYDMVIGARESRDDAMSRRLGSRVAHWLMRKLFVGQTADTISSFRILSRRVVNEYLKLPEHHSYVAALLSWLGYPQTSILVRHEASKLRKSRYTFKRLLRLWIDLAIGFTDRPLRFATWLGMISSAVALVLGLRVIVLYFVAETPVPGYTSLFAAQAMFFGVTMVFLGIQGEYLSRIFREVKGRPFYLVDHQKSIRLLPPHREG